MGYLFLGVLIGSAIVLLLREWLDFARERRDPTAHHDYAWRTFRRRACVSLLLLAVAALVLNQPIFEQAWTSPLARLSYMSAYLVVVVLIYVLLWRDFVEGRRMALMLRAELAVAQQKHIAELQQIYHEGGTMPADVDDRRIPLAEENDDATPAS